MDIHRICMCVYLCPFVSLGLSYRIIESVFVFYRFHRSGEYGRLRVAVFMGSHFSSHKSPPMFKTHHHKSLWCCKNSLIRVCQERVCLRRSEACVTHRRPSMTHHTCHGSIGTVKESINSVGTLIILCFFFLLKDTVKGFTELKKKFEWLCVELFVCLMPSSVLKL